MTRKGKGRIGGNQANLKSSIGYTHTTFPCFLCNGKLGRSAVEITFAVEKEGYGIQATLCSSCGLRYVNETKSKHRIDKHIAAVAKDCIAVYKQVGVIPEIPSQFSQDDFE